MKRRTLLTMGVSIPLSTLSGSTDEEWGIETKTPDTAAKLAEPMEPILAQDEIMRRMATKIGTKVLIQEGEGDNHHRKMTVLKLTERHDDSDWWLCLHTRSRFTKCGGSRNPERTVDSSLYMQSHDPWKWCNPDSLSKDQGSFYMQGGFETGDGGFGINVDELSIDHDDRSVDQVIWLHVKQHRNTYSKREQNHFHPWCRVINRLFEDLVYLQR